MREMGQSVAALWASQAAIYNRYGFACCHPWRTFRIDTADIGFADGDGGSCSVERQDPNRPGLEDQLRTLYDSFVEGRVCAFSWGRDEGGGGGGHLLPLNALAGMRDGGLYEGSLAHVALALDRHDGTPRGYIVYTTNGGNSLSPGHPTRGQLLTVLEFVWQNIDAYRSIWSFLASHDLVGEVRVTRVPTDDPAPQIFAEPRLLRPVDTEGSWWRVVDARAALAGRSYPHATAGSSITRECSICPASHLATRSSDADRC